MKPLFTALILAFATIVSAQQKIQETAKGMNLGTNNSFSIELPDYDTKLVEKTWKSFAKQYKGKNKNIKRSDEIFIDNAEVLTISPNPIDLYATINSRGTGSNFTLWVDLGGIFINSSDNPKQYQGVETLLQDFQGELLVEAIKIELDEEEKRLKDLEKSLTQLEKANEKYHKQIEQWKQDILEAEAGIEQNLAEQEGAKQAINTQNETINEVKDRLNKAKSN